MAGRTCRVGRGLITDRPSRRAISPFTVARLQSVDDLWSLRHCSELSHRTVHLGWFPLLHGGCPTKVGGLAVVRLHRRGTGQGIGADVAPRRPPYRPILTYLGLHCWGSVTTWVSGYESQLLSSSACLLSPAAASGLGRVVYRMFRTALAD